MARAEESYSYMLHYVQGELIKHYGYDRLSVSCGGAYKDGD